MASNEPTPQGENVENKKQRRKTIVLILFLVACLATIGTILASQMTKPSEEIPDIPQTISVPTTIPTAGPTKATVTRPPVLQDDVSKTVDKVVGKVDSSKAEVQPPTVKTQDDIKSGNDEQPLSDDAAVQQTNEDDTVGPKRNYNYYDGAGQIIDPSTVGNNRVFVPCVDAYSRIETHSVDSNGYLILNPNPYITTIWRDGAPINSKIGTTFLAGHVNYNQYRGAFYNLRTIKPGCMAYVRDSAGHFSTFKLVSLTQYPQGHLPASLWNKYGPRQLVIETCGGTIHYTSTGRHYDKNIVALFTPVS